MKCQICGKEMLPTEVVENPVSGGMSAVDYMCPNECEYIAWLEKEEKK